MGWGLKNLGNSKLLTAGQKDGRTDGQMDSGKEVPITYEWKSNK